MTRYVPEGTVEVALVTTIVAPATPTPTELNNAVDITAALVGDLVLPFEGSAADSADMSSKFNSTVDSDYGGQPGSFTIHKEKDSGADVVFTALARGTTGWIAIAVRGLATPGTYAAGDKIDLVPIKVLSRTQQYARGTTMRVAVQVAITGVPLEDYTLTI